MKKISASTGSTSTVIRLTRDRKKMSNTSNQTVVKICNYHHKNIQQYLSSNSICRWGEKAIMR
jgi:predicted house-cleaning NTP pyrophosphatase (Maf/HAM1 superfamily)